MYVVMGHCVSQSIEQSLNALWRLRLRLSHFVSKILLMVSGTHIARYLTEDINSTVHLENFIDQFCPVPHILKFSQH